MEPVGYRLVRRLAALLLSVFYQRVEVVAPERLPATGPLILTANHQNALVDPMILLAIAPRPLRPVAKAPLFRHPLIGPFLRLAGAIPVHRRHDPGSDPARNEEMFRAAIMTLAEGGAILIFPEGVSQGEPALMPLRTGTARMLLSAEAAANGRLGVCLLPAGLVFREPGLFRAGRALVLLGTAVPTEDCVALYRSAPDQAVRQLTDRLADALRGLIVEAQDRKILRLLTVVQAVWREESHQLVEDTAIRTAWLQRAAEAYRYLMAHDPQRVDDLVGRVERYEKDLALCGVTDRELSQSYPAHVVRRYALREGLSLLLGLPVALWGIANHLVPYQLTAAVVRWLSPSPDSEATYKLSVGLVLYPLCWTVEGWIAWRLGGPWVLATFIAALVPTGFLALTWWERLTRVRREARGFFQFVWNRDLRRRLLARRRALMDELTELARSVPESVRAGRTSATG